jgi:nitrate/nitrite transport system ATP-binding protein
MMTTGPHAHVGDILQVPFERPRDRQAVLNHPEYYDLRERLMGFLESQDHRRPQAAPAEPENREEPDVPLMTLAMN